MLLDCFVSVTKDLLCFQETRSCVPFGYSFFFFFNFFLIHLFIFGCAGSFFFFFCFSGFSLVAASEDYSLVAMHRLLTEESSLAAEHGL